MKREREEPLTTDDVTTLYPDIENMICDAVKSLSERGYVTTSNNIFHELHLAKVTRRHIYNIVKRMNREGKLISKLRQSSVRKLVFFIPV
ncbi:MAG: hypothetical protein JXA38_04065 [Methanosarcinaceae archaeon]|nr:hypothetical protein [Methanosarcinaceae archaeon]